MDSTLTNLIKALRVADVPVSIGESIDALKTVAITGYDDRQFLKDSLATVMAKSEEEKATFNRLFDLYFSRTIDPNFIPDEEPGNGEPQSDEERAENLLQMIQSGDGTGLAMAMERAGQEVGVENIQFSTQTGYLARRMLDEMGLRQLEERMIALYRENTEDASTEAAELNEARSELLGQAREFVGRQFEVYGEAATERFLEDYLERSRLTDIGRHDMDRMRRLVSRMAKRLASKHSRRRKLKNRGTLDIRKTMRANAGYDGVPFETKWRQKKRDKAKVVAICDVSQSVANYSRFLLMLLYSLNEVIPEIRSFAFSARLLEISDDLESLDIDDAIKKILKEAGFGSTDYGQALSDLRVNSWDAIDRRTTVIMLGDGRSNYGDPRIDIMRELHDQAKRVIWLCPEYPTLWGTGDSEIPRFAPFCHLMRPCSTVKDLERVIDDILRSYE